MHPHFSLLIMAVLDTAIFCSKKKMPTSSAGMMRYER